MNGVEPVPLPKIPAWRRLVSGAPPEHAAVEIRNLVAERPLGEIDDGAVDAILHRYKATAESLEGTLADLYAAVLKYRLEDREFSDGDRADLLRLRRALHLSDRVVDNAHRTALEDVYRSILASALDDGHLSDDEKLGIAQARLRLGISEAEADRVYAEEARRLITWTLSQSLSDGRYTTTEEALLQQMAGNLGVTLTFDDRTARAIDRAKRLAAIEGGELPTHTDDAVRLQRGEVIHSAFPCIHKELKSVTKTFRYSGPTASIRIVKGVRWRLGSVNVERVQQDVLKDEGVGILYITNKRALFVAESKVAVFPHNKIVRFTVYSDGLEIQKDTGRPHYFIRLDGAQADEPTGDPLYHGTVLNVAMQKLTSD